MSIKKPQLLLIILAALGFSIYSYTNNSKPVPKKFASQIYVSQYTSRGIVDRVVGLKIKTKSIQKEDSAATEVVAFVSMPFDFDGSLQYKWTLGQEVHLVEGELTGTTDSGFYKEVPKQLKIVVTGYDAKNLRHIGLEVWGDKNGRRLYTDSLISSQKENSFEDIVQNVEKLRAEKLGNGK